MLTLYIMRHAKSAWDCPDLSDHDRPLKERGIKAAQSMGAAIKSLGAPNFVLCSSAKRAQETLTNVMKGAGEHWQYEICPEIYGSSASGVLHLIRMMGEAKTPLLLVGHNPTFQELAMALTSNRETQDYLDLCMKMPTGALAVLEFPISSYRSLDWGLGKLKHFICPRDLAIERSFQ